MLAQRFLKQPHKQPSQKATIAQNTVKAVVVGLKSAAKGCLDTSNTLATIHSSSFKNSKPSYP